MAHDLTRKILELTKLDNPADDQLKLQQLFRQERKKSPIQLRKMLKRLVRASIINNPDNTSLLLSGTINGNIRGSSIGASKRYYLLPGKLRNNDELLFVCESYDENCRKMMIHIIDPHTRILIEHAVIPLGLEWCVNNHEICIGWGHWVAI